MHIALDERQRLQLKSDGFCIIPEVLDPENEERAMMFAYYTTDFVRQQANWESALSRATKTTVDAQLRQLLGLGPAANTRMGAKLTQLQVNEND